MKLLFRTDEHLTVNPPECRTDNFLETLARKLKWLTELGEKLKATHITSGDITDKEIYTSTNYLLDTINFVENHMPQTTGIVGNHDLRHRNFSYLDQSIASVFISSGLLNLITGPYEITKDVWLHGYSYGLELTHPDMDVYPEESKHIMLYHGYVFKEGTSIISGYSAKALMDEFPEFDMFLTGDHHEKFVVEQNGQTLINGGPFYRRDITKKDYQPVVWLIDTDDLSYEAINVPIEEGVISLAHKEAIEEKKERMESVVDVVRNNEGVVINYKDILDGIIVANEKIMNVNIETFISRSLEENE